MLYILLYLCLYVGPQLSNHPLLIDPNLKDAASRLLTH